MLRLQQLRLDARLSRAALAERTGMTYAQLRNIEQGATPNPRVDTLGKLADALNARPSELLMDALPPSDSADVAA